MVAFGDGAALTDEEVEARLRSTTLDCVDPGSIDQADLLAFSEGPVRAEVGQQMVAHLARCEYCTALSGEYRQIALEKRRKKRGIRLGVGLSIAAAAAILALILLPPIERSEVRAYELAELKGTIAKTMAAPSVAVLPEEPWHFAATSPIELVLRPSEETGKGSVPDVAVYTASKGGPLVRASGVSVLRGDDAGFVVLRISASGESVFGKNFGERSLVVVLAPGDAHGALDAIAGRTIEELPRSLQTFAFDVVYEQ